MLLVLPELLSHDTLEEVRKLAAQTLWSDGALTAGRVARGVKRNEQADLSTRSGARLRDLVRDAVDNHRVLRAAAQPRRFSKLIISRTRENGGYGLHSDNAFMGEGDAAIRTDLSFTLFLSDPASYEGGALEIEQAGATQRLKPEAGTLVLYPSGSLHSVEKVRSGERLAAIGWIESRVRDSAAREILFDLENLRASLSERHDAQSAEMLTLAKTISNLLRRWGTA